MNTDKIFWIFTVISNRDFPMMHFAFNKAEREKSIWQSNSSIKLDRPLTVKQFEVTVIINSLNLKT
jgi:hypothetical protein